MNAAQVTAFNTASGTTVGELQMFILTMLFVIACIWAVIMFWGKITSFKSHKEIDALHILWTALRVLAVVVVILFLVNV